MLLWIYRKLTNTAKRMLKKHYDNDAAERIALNTFEESKRIIDRLPYVGGHRNMHSFVIELNGLIVALYKAMKEEGRTPEEAIFIAREVSQKLIRKIPRAIGLFIGKLAFTGFGIKMFKKQAELSQKREYPEDFVFESIVTKRENGEIEILNEFSECAVHKFYDAEGVAELKAYCNFFDPLFSARFEMGVNSNHTFAQGEETCKLSFANKRKTFTPDNIVLMMEKAKESIRAE